jgi:phosphomannomutase
VDKDGTWLTPNQILTLALYHLKKNRGWTGAVVRTVPSSHQVDAVAKMLGVKVYETPVGFKYIGALMESEPIIVGGEESGGLSVKGHVPEKDGILACLLMAELVATEIPRSDSQGTFQADWRLLHRPRQRLLCAGEKGRAAGEARERIEKHRPVSGGKIHHDRRLQVSFAGRRMGCFPRQRHRAAHPLLH